MSFAVRDGEFDVVIIAGPRVPLWPSVGVYALSSLCADAGLSVGVFGGENLNAMGVLPLPGTGGLVLVEDQQHRIHRITGRAVIRWMPRPELPDPFEGWYSPGLLPLSTAERLRAESQIAWGPGLAVLGSGNRALRFASSLLESGVEGVVCVETYAQWGAKRFAGWEVERRRFEIRGGRLIEGRPVRLESAGALRWCLHIENGGGTEKLEVARVVSAGPFAPEIFVREDPPGSFLFEFKQTAGSSSEYDIEGWRSEEARARMLAGKLIKALAGAVGEEERKAIEKTLNRARLRLKKLGRHREEPFTPFYNGKWMASADSRRVREFSSVPRVEYKRRTVASVECFEKISCGLCSDVCPNGAFDEARCKGCGRCVAACPAGAIVLLMEKEDAPQSQLTFAWRGRTEWKTGDTVTLVNRRGEALGSGRVVTTVKVEGVVLLTVQVPSHLTWEARGVLEAKVSAAIDQDYLAALATEKAGVPKVEILLDGDKRLVRDRIPVTVALFETGMSRAEDSLFCRDGSCGLCGVMIDGVKRLSCKTDVHRGMSMRLQASVDPGLHPAGDRSALCTCLGVSREQIVERIKNAHLRSPEAVISVTHVGEGRCHGALCTDSLRRLLEDEGLDASGWIDWRFPSREWKMTPASQ